MGVGLLTQGQPTNIGTGPPNIGTRPTDIETGPTDIGTGPTDIGTGPTDIGTEPTAPCRGTATEPRSESERCSQSSISHVLHNRLCIIYEGPCPPSSALDTYIKSTQYIRDRCNGPAPGNGTNRWGSCQWLKHWWVGGWVGEVAVGESFYNSKSQLS